MTGYKKSLLIFLAFLIIFEGFVIVVGDLRRPHWGDEGHFRDSIEYIGQDIGLETIKHYEEMSTPLPFVAYALWGQWFGFDLFHLRWLSIIVAFACYLIFHRLLYITIANDRAVLLGAIFLVVQPYMIGFSIFVYTDMWAILFVILGLLAHVRQRPVLLGVAMAMAILSRQYMVFFTIAAVLYYLLDYWRSREFLSIKMLVACVVATLPYLALVILWGGPSPDNQLRQVYLGRGLYFQPIVVTLYLCLLLAYHLPLLVFYLKRFYTDVRVLVASVILSAWYFIFPVGPTQPSIDVGIPTVGLFNRFLRVTLGDGFLVQVAFYLCFLLALPVFLFFVRDCYTRWRAREFDLAFMMDLAILSFFVVMPFSYLGWEKYFMPAVPLVILRLLLLKYERKMKPTVMR